MGGPRIIWCIGVYASASTWVFNVVRLLHEAAEPPAPALTYFCGGRIDLRALGTGVTHIVKSHEINDPGTIGELARQASHIIMTLRDPRDAVSSLMLYHQRDFTRALDLVEKALRLCVRFAGDSRAILYHYESGFFDDPATPGALAQGFGLRIPQDALARIFHQTRRAEIEKHIARMPGLPGMLRDRASADHLDPATHWHTYHANRTGEVGRWRGVLTPHQARTVEAHLRDCFRFYAPEG